MHAKNAGLRTGTQISGWAVYLAVGLLVVGWLLNTPTGLLGKADAIGYAVCHRIDLRSFHLGNRQLPMCARCTGMYLGALLALVYQLFLGRRRGGMPSRTVGIVLGALALAFTLDGANSFFHLLTGRPGLYEPQNWLRLLTGTGMGVAIGVALFPAFNQSVWRDWDRRPALRNLGSLAGLLALALVLDLAVLSENPLLLYPLALVSSAAGLGILTLVYMLIGLLLLRGENRYRRASELILPLSAALTFSMLHIALVNLGRFWLTGTWEGFL